LRLRRKEGQRRRLLTQRAQRKAEKTFLPVTPTALATELTSRPRILILLPAVIPLLRRSRNACPELLAIRRCSPIGRARPLAIADRGCTRGWRWRKRSSRVPRGKKTGRVGEYSPSNA